MLSVPAMQCGQCAGGAMWSECRQCNVVRVPAVQCGQCAGSAMWSVCRQCNVVRVPAVQCGQSACAVRCRGNYHDCVSSLIPVFPFS
jgi:hypothetical protein